MSDKTAALLESLDLAPSAERAEVVADWFDERDDFRGFVLRRIAADMTSVGLDDSDTWLLETEGFRQLASDIIDQRPKRKRYFPRHVFSGCWGTTTSNGRMVGGYVFPTAENFRQLAVKTGWDFEDIIADLEAEFAFHARGTEYEQHYEGVVPRESGGMDECPCSSPFFEPLVSRTIQE